MLLQSSVIGLLSLAVAITMLTGGIDLSINATANLTSITVAILLSIPPAAAMSPSQPLPLLSLLDSCSALVAVFSMGS